MILPDDPSGVEDLCLAVGELVTASDSCVVDQLAALAQALGFILEHARSRGLVSGDVTETELKEFVERYTRRGAAIEAAIDGAERKANAN